MINKLRGDLMWDSAAASYQRVEAWTMMGKNLCNIGKKNSGQSIIDGWNIWAG